MKTDASTYDTLSALTVVDSMSKRAADTTITELSECDNPPRAQVEGQKCSQCAYLVRCWREGRSTGVGVSLWRFSAEEVFGERRKRGFRSLEGLIDFVQAGMRETEVDSDSDDAE